MSNKKIIVIVVILLGAAITVSSFIFTSTMSEPTSMQFITPKNTDTASANYLKPESVLTIILLKDGKVFYYSGNEITKGKTVAFPALREVIVTKKNNTSLKDFIVFIKPSEGATYKNTVDVLDEMTINDIKKYSIVEITPNEINYINSLK
jgi:biopolymer transport protein ExbD